MFLKNRESVIATQQAFHTHFKLGCCDTIPTWKTILRWGASFHATGSTLKKKSPGRPQSACTPADVEAVRQSVVQSPQRSARKHAAALRLSDATVIHVLHLDLKFHRYKMAIIQELHAGDWENRVNSCLHILASVPPTVVLLTSDEAHFHLSGCVDKQNFRYWAGTNPKELHKRPLHSERVTVWCAVAEFGVWGPYFFEDSHAVTVTSAHNVEMFIFFIASGVGLCPLHCGHFWPIVPAPDDRGLFPGHIILHHGDIPWSAHSPDLAPCDFFLWGHLKAEVYKH
ncbi:hypothetical protein B7P43_G02863 [Cryptotermes secundus]|uniref:Uncharacterized protein n=1 Tax=Cryptotermes secundus TaxID=105785 RepID=A0A2J7RIL9_9NEOP|nr:hypothetical protein B7P43_G02863 [Cryptotermes secundus]